MQHVSLWTGVAVTIAAFVLMEPLTAVTHRWVMHGFGIGLHRSHHRRVRPGESPRRWEANDAYPVMFAAIVMMGFAFIVRLIAVLIPVGTVVGPLVWLVLRWRRKRAAKKAA